MSAAIFLLTLALTIWRPRGLGIGFSALGGALLALATGVVKLDNLPAFPVVLGNTVLMLGILLGANRILEQTGVLRWVALRLARWNLGQGWRLFLLLGLAAGVMGALLSNFGAALIGTSLAVELLILLGWSPRATFACVVAVGFIADMASLPFTVSNLVNAIATYNSGISPGRYAWVMVPISGATTAIGLGVLLFYLWSHLPATYQPFDFVKDGLKPAIAPATETGDRKQKREIPGREAIIEYSLHFDPLSGYYSANFVATPLSPTVATEGRSPMQGFKVLNSTPVQVILFSWAMFVVAIALRNAGFTSAIAAIMTQLSGWGLSLAIFGTGFLATLQAATLSNLPAAFIQTVALQLAPIVDPVVRNGMAYATAIGCVLGAKLTPWGSLSTLLWLSVLRQRGWHLSWSQYCRLSIILTLPVLFVALLSLAIWLPLVPNLQPY